MPISSYECLFLLDPTKTGTDLDALKAQLHTLLEKHGAEILVGRKWGEQKLAYAIGNHKKGYYYLNYFKIESTKMAEVERDIRLNESILRHMVTHVDPKWEEEMLAVARDEQKQGLQLIHDDESSDSGLGEFIPEGLGLDDGGDSRHRRGPRRMADAEVGKE